jgi:uncharacterized cupin superfamily protein
MRKVNANDVVEMMWDSPKGTFRGYGKQLSEALGRDPQSTDVVKRHPFDVEISRIAPGETPFPYHAHSAQWEFYYVLSGHGMVRDETGWNPIVAGDAVLFKPAEAHTLRNDGTTDLVMLVVADNPMNESHYYPDSEKYGVHIGDRKVKLRSETLDYYDGEE